MDGVSLAIGGLTRTTNHHGCDIFTLHNMWHFHVVDTWLLAIFSSRCLNARCCTKNLRLWYLFVANCKHNRLRLQLSWFFDRFNCDHPDVQNRIICERNHITGDATAIIQVEPHYLRMGRSGNARLSDCASGKQGSIEFTWKYCLFTASGNHRMYLYNRIEYSDGFSSFTSQDTPSLRAGRNARAVSGRFPLWFVIYCKPF